MSDSPVLAVVQGMNLNGKQVMALWYDPNNKQDSGDSSPVNGNTPKGHRSRRNSTGKLNDDFCLNLNLGNNNNNNNNNNTDQ
eukprot:g4110.t1